MLLLRKLSLRVVPALVAITSGVAMATSAVSAARVHHPSVVNAPVRSARTARGVVGYRSVGHGRPLVLIMGLDGSIDAWPPGLVDALARTHRVIALDNAGVGRSTMRPGVLTISRMANDTSAFISAMHLGRPDVLGWSMGGFIAQALSVRHPDQSRRLILAATAPGNGRGVPPSAGVLGALSSGGAGILADLFPPDQAGEAAAYVAAISKYRHIELPSSAVDGQQLAASGRWIAGQDDSGRLIGRIREPVLIADGAQDVILPPANSRVLHRVIKHSQLKLYPDAGHGFIFQDQGAWVKLIDQFLAPQSARHQ